jgi:hypothetical protein
MAAAFSFSFSFTNVWALGLALGVPAGRRRCWPPRWICRLLGCCWPLGTSACTVLGRVSCGRCACYLFSSDARVERCRPNYERRLRAGGVRRGRTAGADGLVAGRTRLARPTGTRRNGIVNRLTSAQPRVRTIKAWPDDHKGPDHALIVSPAGGIRNPKLLIVDNYLFIRICSVNAGFSCRLAPAGVGGYRKEHSGTPRAHQEAL